MLEVIEQHRAQVAKIQRERALSPPEGRGAGCWDGALHRGPQARLSQRPGHRPRADRHHRLPHGLRHHRHRARHRAGEVQAARRRRHAQDRQPDGQARAARISATAPAESAGIVAHIDRYDTIEDVLDEQTGATVCSGLRPEHLPRLRLRVQAAPRHGVRSHYRAHIRMMAAAQPFLSGAISKTVNLPSDATVEDIVNTYIEGWKLGLKAIAIYRDGSKRSAPLATDAKKHAPMSETHAAAVAEAEAVLAHKTAAANAHRRARGRGARTCAQNAMSRCAAACPRPRLAINHKFEIAGHKGYLTVGLFEDGQPGELFIQMNKEGSTIGGLMDTVATLTSICAAIRRAARVAGQEIRLSALRAVGLHQEPRHPPRDLHHRLHLPLAGLPIHHAATRKRPARTKASRTCP